MNVLVAGGSGTIGLPLVRALLADGHQVTALCRSPMRNGDLRAMGASIAAADALNRSALMAAVEQARPTHVIHQLTALPKDGPRRTSDLEMTNRLRIEGTRNLLDASIHVAARRFLVGSFAILAHARAGGVAHGGSAAAAVESMERQVLDASARGAIDGVVLRYGMFYGNEAPSTRALVEMVRRRRLPVVRGDAGQLPLIHVQDAVNATMRALDRAGAGSTFDIVDDRAVSLSQIVEAIADYTGAPRPLRVPAWVLRLFAPYAARMLSVRLPLSNTKAKAELGWHVRYPTMYDGLATMFEKAA